MVWSIVLDVLLVLVFIGAVVHGYRSGLLRTAAGLVGLILGGIAAYFVMPWVANVVPAPQWRAPLAIVAALVLLSLGGIIVLAARVRPAGASRRPGTRV